MQSRLLDTEEDMRKMKKNIVIIAALIMFLSALVSEAADWEYFMENERGDKYYLDLDSIEPSSSGTVKMFQKIEPLASEKAAYLVSNIEMDCTEKRIRLLEETSYARTGESRVTRRNETWKNVKDDDIEELLLELVCSLKPVS